MVFTVKRLLCSVVVDNSAKAFDVLNLEEVLVISDWGGSVAHLSQTVIKFSVLTGIEAKFSEREFIDKLYNMQV